MRDLYNTTKKVDWNFSKSENPVKDKEGRAILGRKNRRT
jgi:hypothetical protein